LLIVEVQSVCFEFGHGEVLGIAPVSAGRARLRPSRSKKWLGRSLALP
jgi:hypothetical protein